MDLNAKIAARRRELAVHAEATKNAEARELEAAVAKRLAEHGLTDVVAPPAPRVVTQKAVDAEVESAVNDAAVKRLTSNENSAFYGLLAVSVAVFVIFTWWAAMGVVIWAFVYRGQAIERHKKAIVAEGLARVAPMPAQEM